ncbi:Rec8 like protein-domain-containing protein [Lophiotrema nucula]|uniref:Rec8 like protein-domain-containing protein n=1 Tax=Lophiotrema nucula TaxID=690887 RepID=A0A6A5ZCA9_9PLEO|nr:Rec8 like protein-domain-containing protein [Lophiotrema nucula]
MFYSHEVLTSRKYGVATVWLVATLGAKSNLKKINRKQILDVDVPKACQTIIDPTAPMALRLQGNLLFGVSRVYLQQCGYVLSDAQNAHNAINMMLKKVKNAGLDPEAGKARPEQLMLQDDPSFLPEFLLPPPELLAELNLPLPPTHPRTGESQSLTPFGSQKEITTPEAPVAGLIIPSSSSGLRGGFTIMGDDGPATVGDIGDDYPTGPLPELDFDFDEYGGFIEHPKDKTKHSTPAAPGGTGVLSDAAASVRVRLEHEAGQQGDIQNLGDQMDVDFPVMFGDEIMDAEAFPTAQQAGDLSSDALQSSSAVMAPMQKKHRARRVLQPDTANELRSKDLVDWNANYLKNMADATRVKTQHRRAILAKKSAEHFVWGLGFGGIGARLPGAQGPTPLDQFCGDALFKLVTGIDRKYNVGRLSSHKRDRDSGIDEATEGEARRVRRKSDEEEGQLGRGEEDEGMFLPQDDEVELPRDAPLALDDNQVFSAMPWNISASVRGSSAVPRSGLIPSSLTGPHGSIRPRGGRMVTESPLHGRGQPGGLDALKSFEGEDEFGFIGSDDFGFAPGGPGLSSEDLGGVSPVVQQSFQVREALSAETGNFLTFVADGITEKSQRAAGGNDVGHVFFDELLPPTKTNRMVAAQGLMMILALGTKGLLIVSQKDVEFGDIGLSLSDQAKKEQTEAIQEEDEHQAGKESEGEQRYQEDEAMDNKGGQFEEQFASHRGAEEEADDHDSLYDE